MTPIKPRRILAGLAVTLAVITLGLASPPPAHAEGCSDDEPCGGPGGSGGIGGPTGPPAPACGYEGTSCCSDSTCYTGYGCGNSNVCWDYAGWGKHCETDYWLIMSFGGSSPLSCTLNAALCYGVIADFKNYGCDNCKWSAYTVNRVSNPSFWWSGSYGNGDAASCEYRTGVFSPQPL